MKFGIRTPSLKKRIAARTSIKHMVRAKVRMPRGTGFITNPKRAAYNAVYHRTTISADRVVKGISRKKKGSSTGSGKVLWFSLGFLLLPVIWPFLLVYLIYRIAKR